jgi:16S rRNA (uracil1498-N3)-methyltransferase
MRLNYFIGKFDLTTPTLTISDSEIVSQIRNVLRLGEGEQILLGDGNSSETLGIISRISKSEIDVALGEVRKNMNELSRHITLYCSIIKRDNFELVAQKATEIGVREIVPIISERTIKTSLQPARINKIIREAGEQSGRGILPLLHEPHTLERALTHSHDVNICLDSSGSDCKNFKIQADAKNIGIFIGPEGGWSDNELELFRFNQAFNILSFGPLTLRAETAAVVGSFLWR